MIDERRFSSFFISTLKSKPLDRPLVEACSKTHKLQPPPFKFKGHIKWIFLKVVFCLFGWFLPCWCVFNWSFLISYSQQRTRHEKKTDRTKVLFFFIMPFEKKVEMSRIIWKYNFEVKVKMSRCHLAGLRCCNRRWNLGLLRICAVSTQKHVFDVPIFFILEIVFGHYFF